MDPQIIKAERRVTSTMSQDSLRGKMKAEKSVVELTKIVDSLNNQKSQSSLNEQSPGIGLKNIFGDSQSVSAKRSKAASKAQLLNDQIIQNLNTGSALTSPMMQPTLSSKVRKRPEQKLIHGSTFARVSSLILQNRNASKTPFISVNRVEPHKREAKKEQFNSFRRKMANKRVDGHLEMKEQFMKMQKINRNILQRHMISDKRYLHDRAKSMIMPEPWDETANQTIV